MLLELLTPTLLPLSLKSLLITSMLLQLDSIPTETNSLMELSNVPVFLLPKMNSGMFHRTLKALVLTRELIRVLSALKEKESGLHLGMDRDTVTRFAEFTCLKRSTCTVTLLTNRSVNTGLLISLTLVLSNLPSWAGDASTTPMLSCVLLTKLTTCTLSSVNCLMLSPSLKTWAGVPISNTLNSETMLRKTTLITSSLRDTLSKQNNTIERL